MQKLKVVVGKQQHEVILEGSSVWLNGQPAACDVITLGNRRLHLLLDGRSLTCELLRYDAAGKRMELLVNNKPVQATIRSPLDELLEQMGMQAGTTRREPFIRAPMPGLVLDVLVQAGQAVEPGTSLLILEAMKMENSIKAHEAATVKSVQVKKGDAVEKNQVLMELE
ncbi:MAG: acetyl-CoA carboxylase biotin carboxyl carrier protein subunit [Chitinophagales bacterium]|nr:acetyl-CoA carboxylase biotin carboxyl carrier protein subunit [Chitinophagales bacterium]MDW8394344.1 acetyl-CoA carboxylase biotin carboxyl carrier protein subunit [Chitinophagales bacterium]